MLYRTENTQRLEQLLDGTVLEIRHSDDVVSSIVYPFFLRQFADLIERRLTIPGAEPPLGSCSAVYATQNGEVIGHIVYYTIAAHKTSSILLSAVRSDYRGCGLYNIMHKYFEHYAKLEGSEYLTSWTHKNNTSRHRSASKVGLVPKYIVMGKYIK